MNLNFYTLCVIYLVYSFLGWVGETVVATAKGRRFTNRGVASGPFCFVYGTAGVLITIGLNDQRASLAALFFGSMIYATVVEWLTAKLLERIHHRRWWDYSDKKFNLDGYVCLQYSLLWGLLGMAAVRWGNDLLFRLCAHLPPLLFHAVVWGGMALAVLDQISAMVVVSRYANRHPRLEQLNRELGRGSERLRQKITASVEKRIQRAYPAAARPEPTTSAEKQLSCRPALALCHRGFPRGCGGDHLLPHHRRGLDEPFQPGLGPVQRGMGAGAGAGRHPAAGRRTEEREPHLLVRCDPGRCV